MIFDISLESNISINWAGHVFIRPHVLSKAFPNYNHKQIPKINQIDPLVSSNSLSLIEKYHNSHKSIMINLIQLLDLQEFCRIPFGLWQNNFILSSFGRQNIFTHFFFLFFWASVCKLKLLPIE